MRILTRKTYRRGVTAGRLGVSVFRLYQLCDADQVEVRSHSVIERGGREYDRVVVSFTVPRESKAVEP